MGATRGTHDSNPPDRRDERNEHGKLILQGRVPVGGVEWGDQEGIPKAELHNLAEATGGRG